MNRCLGDRLLHLIKKVLDIYQGPQLKKKKKRKKEKRKKRLRSNKNQKEDGGDYSIQYTLLDMLTL